MSVGHIARGFEKAGIPTVIIAVEPFAYRLEMMSLPRVLITKNIIGRVLGSPGDIGCQKAILQEAIGLLESASHNGTVVFSKERSQY
jgi:hypothetical protein